MRAAQGDAYCLNPWEPRDKGLDDIRVTFGIDSRGSHVHTRRFDAEHASGVLLVADDDIGMVDELGHDLARRSTPSPQLRPVVEVDADRKAESPGDGHGFERSAGRQLR